MRARFIKQADVISYALLDANPRECYLLTLTLTRLLNEIERLNVVLAPPPDPNRRLSIEYIYPKGWKGWPGEKKKSDDEYEIDEQGRRVETRYYDHK